MATRQIIRHTTRIRTTHRGTLEANLILKVATRTVPIEVAEATTTMAPTVACQDLAAISHRITGEAVV